MGGVDPVHSDAGIREARAAEHARLSGALLTSPSTHAPEGPIFRGPRQHRADLPFDVLAIGQNSLDRLYELPRHPKRGDKVEVARCVELPGGQVASAALGCRRLGLAVAYVGAVGEDLAAEAVLAPLEAAGVDVTRVQNVSGAFTQQAVILVEAGSGERTILCRRDPNLSLGRSSVSRSDVESARAVLLDAGDPDLGFWVARVARELSIPVILDADRYVPELRRLLERVDFPLVSRGFSQDLSGDISGRAALSELVSLGAKLAIVTLGENGAIAGAGDRVYESTAFRVDAVDTTGAGDAFHAAFAMALLDDANTSNALRFANAAAAMNCRALGAQAGLPNRRQLETFLSENEPAF